MPKKHRINEADLETFRKAVEGAKPIKQKQRIARSAPAKQTNPSRRTVKEEPLPLSEAIVIPPVQGEEFIAYKQTGVSHKTLRKLQKGQYTIDAMLDLHGLTIEAALDAVSRFIQKCVHEEAQVVLIIHGKGRHGQMPILKNKLNLWLRTIDRVLAFCSAAPGHGSRGAVYVLLKK